jgi:hypothetical protein
MLMDITEVTERTFKDIIEVMPMEIDITIILLEGIITHIQDKKVIGLLGS